METAQPNTPEARRALREAGIACIVGDYPGPSHTFVQREVLGLRALGYRVETISIHRQPPEHILTDLDKSEFERTFTILPPDYRSLASSLVTALLRRPAGLLRAIALSQRNNTTGLRGRVWGAFYVVEAVVVWDFCRRTGIRHVHAHHGAQASDAAMLAAQIGNTKRSPWTWSSTMHGPTEFYGVDRFRLALKVRDAAATVAISAFGRSQLLGLVEPEHWPNVHVVHCGVDTSTFVPRTEVPGPQDKLRILTIGRLVPVKGHAVLLEAIARLSAAGVPIEATVIGWGPDGERLRQLSEERGLQDIVHFVGSVGQDRIPGYIAAADVFCLPSFAEGIPVVLMEAMACEVPVISTRTMGIPELIEDGHSGLLVPPGEIDPLVDAIQRLHSDASLRLRLGHQGRLKVQQEFELEECVVRLANVLDDAVASGS